jgi:type I restriction enzyme S subunit
MKQGWEVRKLGDVCELINRGVSPKYTETNGLIVLNQKCIRNHKVNYELARTHDDKVKPVSHEKLIQIGDVLINSTGTGTLGRVAQIRDEPNHATVDSHITIVRPLANVFYNDFFGYALILIEEEIAKRGEGCGGQTELARSTLKNEFNISYPKSLPEQQRIVALLDEAFAAIAQAKSNAEQNLKNAKELFESYLRAVLSDKQWVRKTLNDICERVEYGSSTKSKEDGDIAVLRMGNIQNGRLNWDKLVYSNDINDNEKYLLKYNDVLFNRTNSPELVGKTAIYKGEMPAIFAGYLIRIHRNESLLDADYLNYYLNSEMAMEYGKTVVISSVNQANINGTKLKGYPIPCPPLKDQQIIVQKLDALSAETKQLETIYQQKINDLDELKKSILQKAFAGELC